VCPCCGVFRGSANTLNLKGFLNGCSFVLKTARRAENILRVLWPTHGSLFRSIRNPSFDHGSQNFCRNRFHDIIIHPSFQILGLRAHRLGALRTVRVRKPQRTPVYTSASSLCLRPFAGPGSAEAASRRRAPFLNSPCSFCRLRVGVREACYREFFELFNRPIQPEFRSRRCDLLLVARGPYLAVSERRTTK